MKGGRSSSSGTGLEAEDIVETIFRPVISNGQNELIVQAPPRNVLRGAFLYQDDLCTIVTEEGRPYAIFLNVYFQPLALEITACANEHRTWLAKDLSRNKLAFAKLLIAKHLSEMNGTVVNELSRVLIAVDSHDSCKSSSWAGR